MSARALLTRMGRNGAIGARLKMSNPMACGSASGRTLVSRYAKAGPATQPHTRVRITSLALRRDFIVWRRLSSRPMDARFATL